MVINFGVTLSLTLIWTLIVVFPVVFLRFFNDLEGLVDRDRRAQAARTSMAAMAVRKRARCCTMARWRVGQDGTGPSCGTRRVAATRVVGEIGVRYWDSGGGNDGPRLAKKAESTTDWTFVRSGPDGWDPNFLGGLVGWGLQERAVSLSTRGFWKAAFAADRRSLPAFSL